MTRVEKAARRDAVREQYASGLLVKEIAERFGITEAYVCTICKDIPREGSHKGFIDVLRSNSVEVIALIKNDVPQREIAERFGVSRHTVQDFAKEQDLLKEPTKINAEEAARRISIKSNGCLQYVSGYTIKEKPVRVRCVVCGGEFERTYHNITTKGRVTCPHCVKAESEKNKQVKILNKTIQEQKKKAERFSRSQLISMRTCAECGELFIPKSKSNTRCSSACTRRAFNRNADARLNENNVVDKDITLTKLYKRDDGVCYLCGRKCNWNDYVTRSNGVVVAGDSYPSVEHVIPLSKGGLHSWDNVMLACRGCNTKKNAKILEA